MKRILFLLTIFFIIFSIKSSAQSKILNISNNLETYSDSIPWINLSTKVMGDAFSGNYFSSTDSTSQFGLGYKGPIPYQFIHKNIHISFSEFIRTNKAENEFAMVIQVLFGDSTIVWNARNISERKLTPLKWTKITDSIDIPSSFTGKDFTLAIYLWNKNGRGKVDLDDLEISFEEKEIPTFLPAGFIKNETDDGWQNISEIKDFSFLYNKDSGEIKILNAPGDTIITSIAIFSEWYNESKKSVEHTLTNHWLFKNDSISANGNYFNFLVQNEITKNELTILAGKNGNLVFNINSVFLNPVTLYRHALIIGYSLPVNGVYKKSTLTDSADFKNEYWLDKEGFNISNGISSYVIYHPEQVSSLQLDVQNESAIINMDYSADHPLLHFPLLKKSQNKFEDHSASVYKENDVLKSSFTFYSVMPQFHIAKMMANSYGYLSSFIWTEHADYTDLRTQKAVYFGSENINSLNESTGGFLKYSIPVTKSIFYSNPDNVDNSEKAGYLPGPEANYKGTVGFSNFLKQLDEYGIEICLHTPDHYTCDRKLLSEALDMTRREFSPVSWIDHGYDNSILSNREDLACDGADSTSKWYAADLWKKYGIKYFWNSYFEDSGIFRNYSFNSFFSVPYSGWEDAFPTPVYWKNKTRTEDIIHWRTTNTMDPSDGSLWSYYFNDLRLTDMVNNRDNIIIHCYPARVDSSNGFYILKDGVILANEEFNHALQKLSSYRLQEKIQLTTIRDMLNYRTSLENISYEIMPDGNIRIQNNNREAVKGLSFSTSAKQVKAGTKEISVKTAGSELIFWFDIAPGEYVILTLN